ncbi:MAG: 2-amino-4-hydroxy-6-hydroxymethyldihydropteridine diphosphokinase [Pseudomonadota bacterium]|nr:2-amino-4-hydroxy-6-hydroxymethyldihydropteridine diphosphokinase [Pseudomonadota bacterium]
MQLAPVSAYVGLGSNLQSPVEQISTALIELNDLPLSRVVRASSLYRSAPMVAEDDVVIQPDYINAVVLVETTLTPQVLLQQLQQLEQLHQRRRERRWGPRSLDLDLLLYGDEIIDSCDLVVPHPGLCERNFVLVPLFEIAPDLILPDNRALVDLMALCSHVGIECIAD